MTKKKAAKVSPLKTGETLKQTPEMLGWRCPVCGRGNSPFSTTCPCVVSAFPMVQPPWDYPTTWPGRHYYDPNLPYYVVTSHG